MNVAAPKCVDGLFRITDHDQGLLWQVLAHPVDVVENPVLRRVGVLELVDHCHRILARHACRQLFSARLIQRTQQLREQIVEIHLAFLVARGTVARLDPVHRMQQHGLVTIGRQGSQFGWQRLHGLQGRMHGPVGGEAEHGGQLGMFFRGHPPGKPLPQGCCGQFFQSRQFIRREIGQFPVELQYFPHGQGAMPIPFKALDVGKGHRHQIRFPYPDTQRVQPGATPAVPVNTTIQPLACRVVGSPEKLRQLVYPALPPRCLEPFERFAPLLPCLAKRLCRRQPLTRQGIPFFQQVAHGRLQAFGRIPPAVQHRRRLVVEPLTEYPPVIAARLGQQAGRVIAERQVEQSPAVEGVFAQHALAPAMNGEDGRLVHAFGRELQATRTRRPARHRHIVAQFLQQPVIGHRQPPFNRKPTSSQQTMCSQQRIFSQQRISGRQPIFIRECLLVRCLFRKCFVPSRHQPQPVGSQCTFLKEHGRVGQPRTNPVTQLLRRGIREGHDQDLGRHQRPWCTVIRLAERFLRTQRTHLSGWFLQA